MKILLLLLLPVLPLFAESIDRSMSRYQSRIVNKHVDYFDFSGSFPTLENIDIDARRKKCVDVDLSGEYPLLSSIIYEGSFGCLKGKLTGAFPSLKQVVISCTSCLMDLDLTGEWKQSCHFSIRGQKEDIILKLPEEVGLIIHTKTAPAGSVTVKKGLEKQGWFKVWKKTYISESIERYPIILTLDIETTKGNIILN